MWRISPSGEDELSARRSRANELINSWFGEWYALLVRYAAVSTRCVAAAEEIVQDAFVDLFRALMEGKVIESPKAWLFCAVKRKGIDLLRQEKRHGGAFLPLTDATDVPSHSAGADPADLPDDRLGALLFALTAREQQVLLLRASSMKYRQIAATLGIGTNSVKTLLGRAIRKTQTASKAQIGGRQSPVGDEYDGDVPKTLQ